MSGQQRTLLQRQDGAAEVDLDFEQGGHAKETRKPFLSLSLFSRCVDAGPAFVLPIPKAFPAHSPLSIRFS